jgi:hypothetical protein
MAQVYELAVQTSAVGTGAPALEIVAVGRPISLLELELSNNAATAYNAILGRPGNTPAGGTVQTATLPANLPTGGVASGGGTIIAGWTTAPTIPAAGNHHRRFGFAAAIGNGGIAVWGPREMMLHPTRSSSLILWNTAAVGVMNVRIRWEE